MLGPESFISQKIGIFLRKNIRNFYFSISESFISRNKINFFWRKYNKFFKVDFFLFFEIVWERGPGSPLADI